VWLVKTFNTEKEKNDFIDSNKENYQMEEIFINNSYGVEYRELLKM